MAGSLRVLGGVQSPSKVKLILSNAAVSVDKVYNGRLALRFSLSRLISLCSAFSFILDDPVVFILDRGRLLVLLFVLRFQSFLPLFSSSNPLASKAILGPSVIRGYPQLGR
jgi:hypothetical protein